MLNIVKDAIKLKNVKIVSYDWLEDSLQAQRHKRESKYCFTIQKPKAKNKFRRNKMICQNTKKESEYVHI